MKTDAFKGRITMGQSLAGMVAILIMLLFTQPSLAEGDDHRALQLLLDKGIITQDEYNKAIAEEQAESKSKELNPTKGALTKGGLTFTIGGFAEIDFTGDSTRSFPEIIGNNAVARNGTLAGNNSQLFSSPRNSRITFDVQAPERNGIKSRYFASMDFLGNQPSIGNDGVSEFSNYASPTARIFQMYFAVNSPLADFKVGQDWSAFGFMSQYSRAQVSVAATPANMFNRWIQASVSKHLRVTDQLSLTPILSIERPPQRDATLPSFVAGIQVAHSGLKAPYAGSSTGDVVLKPISFQISGVGRRLEANSGGQTSSLNGVQPNASSQSYATGWGASSSLFVPILPSRDGGMGNTAHVVMEGVTGAGIADMFNGLSWGICKPVCGSNTNSGFGGTAFGQTNIDGGLAAVSSQTGKFEAIRTTSMMIHGTYYLPDDGKTWIGGGYGTIYSSNAREMTCSAALCGTARTASSIYIRDSTYYGYVFHDFTPEIRMGLETNWVRTTYADGSNAENRRIQLSFFYRF